MKYIKKIKCLIPFVQITGYLQGYCYSCCPTWSRVGAIGKLAPGRSLMDIWNSKRIQDIRKAVLDNDLKKTCSLEYCPYAMNDEYIDLENFKTTDSALKQIIEQIKSGKTELSTGPYNYEMAHSGDCNLKCIMCQSNEKYYTVNKALDEYIYNQLLPELLPGLSRLTLSGSGDSLFNEYSRSFLRNLDASRYPDLKIKLITNAMLFSRNMWQTIKHNNFDSIHVSIDGAFRKTYEYIRKNGHWDILRKNLDLISSLRQQGIFKYFEISFIVMHSNYREMKDFAEWGLALGCDRIVFQRLFGFMNVKENIYFTRNKKVMAEIAGILEDPVFNNGRIDTTLVDGYRKFLNVDSNFFDHFITGALETLFYYPARLAYSSMRYFPPVLNAMLKIRTILG